MKLKSVFYLQSVLIFGFPLRGAVRFLLVQESKQRTRADVRLRSTTDVQWLVGGSLRLIQTPFQTFLAERGRAGNLKFHHRSKFSALDMV